MDPMLLASELRRAPDGARGLPARDLESIGVLINVGEWKVALETLCTQTYEYDLEVDAEQRALLSRLGGLLEVPVGYLLGGPGALAPGEQ